MSLRKRIGVMVPSTNMTFEADFQLVAQLVAPRDVTIHGQAGARYLATASLAAAPTAARA
ncbi:MAG: hypothetical protein ACRELS_17145 [Candidatus Rokuibacteriota bacterium]